MLYMITFIIGVVFLLIYSFKFSVKYQYTNMTFLIMIMLLIVISIILPIMTPYLRLNWTCMSFAAIIYCIYYNQLEQQVDSLTSLLNRKSYDYAIKNIKDEAFIIFFDVDRFKYVNDTYGHNYADKCLIVLSNELKRSFKKYGYCYRYGGDEACVIIKKKIGSIESIINSFFEHVEILREAEPQIPTVSVGYARFNPIEENIESALKRADEMMYRYKTKHRGS